jgi:hypothetical protein
MKLTRSEFCQFTLKSRLELLKEFGENILKKKVQMRLISVYTIFDFYVEVYENLASHQLERVEPVKNNCLLDVYNKL